jgi:D-alanine-D-alanine ligase
LLKIVNENLDQIHLSMVCNVKGVTQNNNDYASHSITTEFLNKLEFDGLLHSAQQYGIYTDTYFDTLDFIESVINKKYSRNSRKYDIVFETTQKGTGIGKDALIASFCDLNNILYTGPNAYLNAIFSNKFDWNKLFCSQGISAPKSWRYDLLYGWAGNQVPPQGELVIIKPLYECASIGIDADSTTLFSNETIPLLNNKCKQFHQPMLVQQFVSGYEVEVPIIASNLNTLIYPPVGIEYCGERYLDKQFMTYDSVYEDNYTFYDFRSESPQIEKYIINCAEEISTILNLKGYIRVDFRVNKNNDFFVFDINSFPHIVKHSSFAYSFEKCEIDHNLILPSLIGNTISFKIV